MTVLLTGPVSLISEWLPLFDEDERLIYSREVIPHLPAEVRHLRALDEAPPVDLAVDLHVQQSHARLLILRDLIAELPPGTPLLCNTAAVTAAELAADLDAWPRLVGVAALPGMLAADTLELCIPAPEAGARLDAVRDMFHARGKRTEVVGDDIGMVFPRILALIINEAVWTHQCGVAGRDDIDTAMRLGVNYPAGPFAWAERIGWENVHALLRALHSQLGDDRYRPATLLTRLALRTAGR